MKLSYLLVLVTFLPKIAYSQATEPPEKYVLGSNALNQYLMDNLAACAAGLSVPAPVGMHPIAAQQAISICKAAKVKSEQKDSGKNENSNESN